MVVDPENNVTLYFLCFYLGFLFLSSSTMYDASEIRRYMSPLIEISTVIEGLNDLNRSKVNLLTVPVRSISTQTTL